MRITFKGQPCDVRELTVKEITEDLVEHVRQSSIDDAIAMSKGLQGKDKSEFLKSSWKDLPTRQEILGKLDSWMQSIQGIRFVVDRAVSPRIDFDAGDLEELSPAIMCALGKFAKDVSKEDPDEPKEAVEARPLRG